MTPRDDYPSEMPEPLVDDAAAEALLTGRWQGDGDLAAVSSFLGALRATAEDPAPPPSPALAAVLADGLPTGVPAPTVAGRRRPSWPRRLRAAALGMGMAATGLTGAAAAGVLPDAVQRAVGSVVEAVTPFSVPKPAGEDTRTLHRPPVGTPSTSARPGTPSKDGGQSTASTAGPGTAATTPGGGPASTVSPGPGGGGTTLPASPAGTGSIPPIGPAPGGPGATVPSPNVTVPPPSVPPLGPATPTVPSVPTTLPVAAGDLPTTTPTTAGVRLP